MRGIDAEIDQFFQEGINEVMSEMERAGQAAVQHNVENGDYKNRTGRLRRSNYYRVSPEELEIGNSAPYASDVESRGYMVCSEGALLAEQMLNAGN